MLLYGAALYALCCVVNRFDIVIVVGLEVSVTIISAPLHRRSHMYICPSLLEVANTLSFSG